MHPLYTLRMMSFIVTEKQDKSTRVYYGAEHKFIVEIGCVVFEVGYFFNSA